MDTIELPIETIDFMNTIRNIWKTKFPNSSFHIQFENHLCPCISIYFYLSKGKEEVSYNILMNDACRTIFQIYSVDKNGKLFDKIEVERLCGNITRRIHKDDPNEKYLCYSSIPVKFRKMNEKKEKIIKGFEKYVNNLAELIINNADDINNGIVNNIYDCRDKVA